MPSDNPPPDATLYPPGHPLPVRACERQVGSEFDPRRLRARNMRNAVRLDRARRTIISEYEGSPPAEVLEALALLLGAVHELWPKEDGR